MVSIAEYCPERDYDGIMALFKRHDMPKKEAEEWKHLWQNNPALKSAESKWPLGWTLKFSGKIVGFLGNIPLEYYLKEQKFTAAAAHSWVVDVEYRKHSILLINNYFRQKNCDFLLNTTGGNPVTQKIFSAYKAKRVPAASYNISFFSIIDYPSFLESLLQKKGFTSLNKLCCLGSPLSFLERWWIRLRNFTRNFSDNTCEAKSCETFDDRFNDFWKRVCQQSNRLLCNRNNTSLNWRYQYALRQRRLWIFTIEVNSQIVAYALFLRDDNPAINLKRVRLIDLQTVENTPNTIFKLLESAEKRCRKEGIHMLEAVGFHPHKRRIISKWLPHKRELPVWPFYLTTNPILEKELLNTDVWDPCLFDGDGTF